MAKCYGSEDSKTEFKTSLVFSNKDSLFKPDIQKYNVFKTICAFMNTQGGCIYIGVREDKGVGYEITDKKSGIFSDMTELENNMRYYIKRSKDADSYSRWVQDEAHKYFDGEVTAIKNYVSAEPDTENVVAIKVQPYRQTIVHMQDGKAYHRIGTTSQVMSQDEISHLEKEFKDTRMRMSPEFQKKEALRKAISEEQYVILKNYKSSHSSTIRDRLVEPIDFQDGESVITCYEPDNTDHKVGCFKISRIERVIPVDKSWKYKSEHHLPQLGLFGWSGPSQDDISVIVPLAVKNVLLEQFPSIGEKNFIEYGDDFIFNGYTRKIEIPAEFFNRYRSVVHSMSENLEAAMERLRILRIEDPEQRKREKLNYAIRYKNKAILVRYRSSNSQTEKDRMVEPIVLQCNGSIISCYEPTNSRHKIGSFKISRMADVEVLENEMWEFENEHIIPELDVFGWSGDKIVHFTVVVSVSVKNSLMEQYPGITENKFSQQDNGYLFVGESRHIEEPASFFSLHKKEISEPSQSLVIAMSENKSEKNSHQEEIRETLRKAMKEHRVVLIKSYRSNHSQEVRDRYVEPIKFHNNESSISCYEEQAKGYENHSLKISRMEDVEILDMKWKYEHKHQNIELDVFGWQLDEQVITFSVIVSLSVKNMLLEQYPGITETNFTAWNNETFRFTAESSHIEIPAKFFVSHLALISSPSPELQTVINEIEKKRINKGVFERLRAAWKIIIGRE